MKHVNYNRQLRRKKKISSQFSGTEKRPRISIFRSSKYIYAQAIDDDKKTTIASYSSLLLKNQAQNKKTKKDQAKEVGKELAKILIKNKVTMAIFDRCSYAYKGRVQALADGLRDGGLKL